MAWEVVTASFETELHARWSIFFDRLEVAWLYEPCVFRDTPDCEFTPAFWLPNQRIWFDAWDEAPPTVMSRWRCFATAAAGRRFEPGTEEQRAPGEPPAERATPLHVDEPWQGMALLSLGPIPCGGVADDTCEAWGSPSEPKMSTANDAPHRWTVCPGCGMFGTGAHGRAERCACLDDEHEHGKTRNDHAPSLSAAYHAARTADLEAVDGSDEEHTTGHRFLRRALSPRPGTTLARRRCVDRCGPVSDELRRDLGPRAWPDAGDAEVLCAACPGFVCASCHEQPAAVFAAACDTCEPPTLLTPRAARDLLNELALELARRHKEPIRAVHTALNRAMGIRTRDHASLAHLAIGLDHIERWLTDHTFPGPSLRALSVDDIEALNGTQLRGAVADRVGPLSAKTGEAVPFVQIRVNHAMGTDNRAQADDDQLRVGLRQIQAWLDNPGSYPSGTRLPPRPRRPSPSRTRA